MLKIRALIPSAILLLVSLAITGVGFSQTELDRVKVASLPLLGMANTFIAENAGYFVDQNIEIEWVPLQTAADPNALTMLLTGEIDVLQTLVSPGVINAANRGEALRIVADSGYNDPESCANSSFLVAEGMSSDFDLASLRGASVAVPAGGASFYLDRLLKTVDLSIADVTNENIPIPARAEALANGAVKLVWLTEPLLTLARQNFSVEDLYQATEIAPNADTAVVIFGPGLIEREDDLGVRYLTAYLQGGQVANVAGSEANIALMTPILNLEPALLEQVCWNTYREDGLINTEELIALMEWLGEQGLIDAVVELDTIYDPSYALQAVTRLPIATPEAGS